MTQILIGFGLGVFTVLLIGGVVGIVKLVQIVKTLKHSLKTTIESTEFSINNLYQKFDETDKVQNDKFDEVYRSYNERFDEVFRVMDSRFDKITAKLPK